MPTERPDDFESRRRHLAGMSDEALDAYFWELVDKIVAPLVNEARTHTSPAIERAVLLRMGFSGAESKALVDGIAERDLLGRGAGRLILELSNAQGIEVRDAGLALLDGRLWEALGK